MTAAAARAAEAIFDASRLDRVYPDQMGPLIDAEFAPLVEAAETLRRMEDRALEFPASAALTRETMSALDRDVQDARRAIRSVLEIIKGEPKESV